MKKSKWLIGLIFFLIILYFVYPWIIKGLFPIKYKDEIIKYSKTYKIDPNLVAAIIKVESDFNPYALSTKGARGLMQIIPSTGMWASEKLNMHNFYIEKLYDPTTNINIGCWYLKNLSKQFNYNLRVVLAAYNGGSGNVSKWLLDKRYSINQEDLEYIPFSETRRYVEKVTFYYDYYKRIYKL